MSSTDDSTPQSPQEPRPAAGPEQPSASARPSADAQRPAGEPRPAGERPSTGQRPTDQFPAAEAHPSAPRPGEHRPAASPFGSPYAPPVRERSRSGRGAGVAGIVLAALVAGSAAGFGGAALHGALDDDGSASARGGGIANVVNQGDAPAEEGSTEAVAASVLPSVVKIDVVGEQAAGSGSGIILTSDGKILTNHHVVELAADGGKVRVSFTDGTSAEATVLGTDPLTDTAVIQAEGVSGLSAATIGKSANLDVGQDVVAVGSPFGLDATVTSGIVSALNRPVNVGRDNAGNSTTYPAIQTDAAINPGNSGGPLVDMTGAVVGINSSIRTAASSNSFGQQGESGSIGLGFAIPIDEVMPIVDQLSNGETPTHARLGIQVSDSGTDVTGALVREVSEDSTAAKSGLEQGDVITAIEDRHVTGADSLVATIRSFRPGDTVSVTWQRDGKEMSADLELDSDEGQATAPTQQETPGQQLPTPESPFGN